MVGPRPVGPRLFGSRRDVIKGAGLGLGQRAHTGSGNDPLNFSRQRPELARVVDIGYEAGASRDVDVLAGLGGFGI